MVDIREERLEPVIVPLSDRIELVVVALGAIEGKPQECGSNNAGDVVKRFLPR